MEIEPAFWVLSTNDHLVVFIHTQFVLSNAFTRYEYKYHENFISLQYG